MLFTHGTWHLGIAVWVLPFGCSPFGRRTFRRCAALVPSPSLYLMWSLFSIWINVCLLLLMINSTALLKAYTTWVFRRCTFCTRWATFFGGLLWPWVHLAALWCGDMAPQMLDAQTWTRKERWKKRKRKRKGEGKGKGNGKGKGKDKRGRGKVKGSGTERGRERKKGQGKAEGEGKVKWGREKEKGKGKEDSLRKVGSTDARTHGHSGDFILCPMLCIAFYRQLVHCTLTAMTRHSAKTVAPKRQHPNVLSPQTSQHPKGEQLSGRAQTAAPKCLASVHIWQ